MDKEIWKDIEGYEGLYQVSSYGRVKSYLGKSPKVLTPRVREDGYARVGLWKDKKVYDFLIHRLVAKTFIKNEEGKPFINHKDNNPSNNCLYNLEWCTPYENSKHMVNQKRHKHGSNHKNSKLTEDEVSEIKKMLKLGENTHQQISEIYGVSRQTVTYINNGKRWRHVS